MPGIINRFPMTTALLVWALVWELVGRLGLVELLPPFTSVLAAMGEVVLTGSFARAALDTLQAFVVGMGIAVVAGVPIGVAMGRSKIADDFLGLWVNLFLSAPLTALVPVIMILFGFGQTTIVVTVVMFAIWIIVLDTRAGVRNASPSLVEMARSFGATPVQLYGKILLLAALPEILTGIRLGRDPRRQGGRDRPAAGLDRRPGRAVRALFAQLPARAVLGADTDPVRVRHPPRRGRGGAGAAGRVFRGRARLGARQRATRGEDADGPAGHRGATRFVITPPPAVGLPVEGETGLFPVRRVYCVGRNYAEHAREMGHDPDREPPFFFPKPADALVTDGRFPYPPATKDVHHEIELVVALGKGGRDIPVAQALDCVYGYAVGLDMTRRDLQAEAKKAGRPWEVGQGLRRTRPRSRPLVPAAADRPSRPRARSGSTSTASAARRATSPS